MAHRDEVEALRARIEAQERDLRDAKAELDMLRAAGHANAAAQAENESGSFGGGMGFGASGQGDGAPMAPLRAETQRRVGVLVLLITTLVTMLFVSTTNCPSGRRDRAMTVRVSEPANAASSSGMTTWAPFVRFARVVDPGMPAAVAADEACAVEVTPVNDGMFDCRVVVRCGEHVLYGENSAGYNLCGPVPSRVVDGNFTRDDGDPRLELDLASGSAVIEERLGLGVQRVELMLAE